MKMVIDIPENDYWLACNYPDALISIYAHYIKKGISLPEKHGRLIDADALIAKYGDWYTEEGTETGFIGTIGMLLKDAPTVVEAEDKDREAEMSDLVERSGITQNCGYCHTDNEGFVRLPLEKHAHAYIWRSADRYGIELRARGWAGRVEINFCPMCGRRLSNERFNREKVKRLRRLE